MVCTNCNYGVHYLDGTETLVDDWDEDEVCYDDNLNMIGDGKHHVRFPGWAD